MLPCVISAGVILTSTFTLFTYSKYVCTFTSSGVERGLDPVFALWITFLPLVTAGFATISLIEHPAKLVLYYRLWEQKIVIDFKPHGLTSQATIIKLIALLLALVGYIIYSLRSDFITDKRVLIVGAAQALSTVGESICRNVSLDGQLQGLNPAFRHYQFGKDQEKDGVNKEKSKARVLSSREKVRKVIEQLTFIPEEHVKHDAIALICFSLKIISPKLIIAKMKHYWKPTQLTAAKVTAYEEEMKWLNELAMWVGRLGNNKTTITSHWSNATINAFYATYFVTYLYYDSLWHSKGSFKELPNRSGSTWLLKTWGLVIALCITAIEVYTLSPRRTTRSRWSRIMGLLDQAASDS